MVTWNNTTPSNASWSQDAMSHNTRYTYNQRGQVTQQWGDGTYPVSYGYDATYGDRTSMSTYRSAPAADSTSWPAVGTADTTTWTFDSASGLMWKKTDAAGKYVTTDYNSAGKTSHRTLARGLVTDYTYDSATGELTGLTYHDGTPNVTYTYTRSGQTDSVVDTTGTWDLVYDSTKPWRLSATGLPAYYGTRTQTMLYESGSGAMVGRYLGFQLGSTAGDCSDLEQRYVYSADGRFDTLTSKRGGSTGPSRTFDYSYLASTPFVSGLTITGGHNFSVAREYETNRNLLKSIDTLWSTTSVARYDYTHNALSERLTAKQSGSAYSDYYVTTGSGTYNSVFNYYSYNARNELETAAMYRGTPPTAPSLPSSADELPGRRFEYRFDSIGNRKNDGPTGDPNNVDDQYTTNALNQYTAKENNTVRFLGTAATAASVDVSGASAAGKKDHAWSADLVPANTTTAVAGTATVYSAVAGTGGAADLINTTTKNYFVPKGTQAFTYDDDGNLTSDGVFDYTYDSENRLVSVQHRSDVIGSTPLINSTNARKLVFVYDYQGRRVRKTTYEWNSATSAYKTTALTDTKFLYDGWNLIAEFDSLSTLTLTRSYTWGLDLTGSLTASGGVGAMLQIYDSVAGKTLLPAYDGNGNVAALLNAETGSTLTLEAAYEYDPFGNLLRDEGAYAASNNFRFSTKYTDTETGLAYYGYRFYSSVLGRFINQDPIAESGGLNLYGFCGNNGANHWDYLGQSWLSKALKKVGNAISSAAKAVVNFVETNWKPIVAIVAAVVTYGVASGWAAGAFAASDASAAAAAYGGIGSAMGDMAAAMSAATYVPSTLAAITTGAVGGAAAGAVSGAIMTGSLSGALKGAATGAISGGIGGYYGNSWNLGRVGVTAVGGGVSSEINGGSFRDGFELSGAIALTTDVAYNMRVAQIENSRHDPHNASGQSSGFFGDAFKLGGGRINPLIRLDDPLQVSPLGGRQGGSGSIFGWGYNPGSAPDHLVEAFAGPHDWLNSWWGYATQSVGKITEGDYAPNLSTFGQHLGSFAGSAARVMNWVDIPLATPIVAASVVGVNPALQTALFTRPK